MKKKKKKWLRRLIWLIILVLLGCGISFIGLPMLKASVTVTYDTYTGYDRFHFKFAQLQRQLCPKKQRNSLFLL